MNDSMTGKMYRNKTTAELEMKPTHCPPLNLPDYTPTFQGEWDIEGVYVYQAYKQEIADYAIEHQRFGGPAWKPTRMTLVVGGGMYTIHNNQLCILDTNRILCWKDNFEVIVAIVLAQIVFLGELYCYQLGSSDTNSSRQ